MTSHRLTRGPIALSLSGETNRTDAGEALPPHFVRPLRYYESVQRQLFTIPFGQALAELGISMDEAGEWFQRGWLAVDPSTVGEVGQSQDERVFEAGFVRDVVRSGLNPDFIQHLFGLLGAPMSFDPDRVAWSFRHGWVEPAPPADPIEVTAENLDSYLDGLAEDGDEQTLRAIRDRINSFLPQDEEADGEESR